MSDGDCDFQPSLDVSSLPQVQYWNLKLVPTFKFFLKLVYSIHIFIDISIKFNIPLINSNSKQTLPPTHLKPTTNQSCPCPVCRKSVYIVLLHCIPIYCNSYLHTLFRFRWWETALKLWRNYNLRPWRLKNSTTKKFMHWTWSFKSSMTISTRRGWKLSGMSKV